MALYPRYFVASGRQIECRRGRLQSPPTGWRREVWPRDFNFPEDLTTLLTAGTVVQLDEEQTLAEKRALFGFNDSPDYCVAEGRCYAPASGERFDQFAAITPSDVVGGQTEFDQLVASGVIVEVTGS
ncbi:MAG TPA: hypothetical protein VHE30_01480 [Polyangiaceae bacterium]|nr:hypothetical protein [Polyangiaceae bacterium]